MKTWNLASGLAGLFVGSYYVVSSSGSIRGCGRVVHLRNMIEKKEGGNFDKPDGLNGSRGHSPDESAVEKPYTLKEWWRGRGLRASPTAAPF